MTEKRIKLWALFISIVWIVAAFFLNWLFTLAIERASNEDATTKLLELSYSFCVLCVVIIEVIIIEILILKYFLRIGQTDRTPFGLLVSLIVGFIVLLALPNIINLDSFRDYITLETSIRERFALLIAICSPACTIKYFLYKSMILESMLLGKFTR